MIETGESENIFQKAIMEQGRGHVSFQASLNYPPVCICKECPAYQSKLLLIHQTRDKGPTLTDFWPKFLSRQPPLSCQPELRHASQQA